MTLHDGKDGKSFCVLCGSPAVEEFLDLGSTALANRFLSREELEAEEPKSPLRVGFCPDCAHVQLMESVSPMQMFENYLYLSSASDTLKNHLWDLSAEIAARYRLGPRDLVIDIGCNDATLLQGFASRGVKALGVDPARNLASWGAGNGIERYTALFNAETANEIVARWGRASVITATNTFPHIQDLRGFIAGIKTTLKPGGTLVMEMHYLRDLLEQVAFDTIYHEHVSYWALRPMQRLFEQNGMVITDVARVPLHHGQLRVFAQRKGEGRPAAAVAELAEEEKAAKLDSIDTYRQFAREVEGIKKGLQQVLVSLSRKGNRVVGYGAPAKGNTLLGFLGIGPDLVEYIVDRSPLKQGLYTPGTHIPVAAPERLLRDQPDYVLLLAWNFIDEILEQQSEYRRRGGRFIIPVPEVRMLPITRDEEERHARA